jgi:hypothetical protein
VVVVAMAILGMSPNVKTFTDAHRAELTDRIATDSMTVVEKYTSDGVFPVYARIEHRKGE